MSKHTETDHPLPGNSLQPEAPTARLVRIASAMFSGLALSAQQCSSRPVGPHLCGTHTAEPCKKPPQTKQEIRITVLKISPREDKREADHHQ